MSTILHIKDREFTRLNLLVSTCPRTDPSVLCGTNKNDPSASFNIKFLVGTQYVLLLRSQVRINWTETEPYISPFPVNPLRPRSIPVNSSLKRSWSTSSVRDSHSRQSFAHPRTIKPCAPTKTAFRQNREGGSCTLNPSTMYLRPENFQKSYGGTAPHPPPSALPSSDAYILRLLYLTC